MKKIDKQLFSFAALCFFSLLVMTAALLCNEPQIQVEFTPPPFEESAESGVPSVPENLGWSELDAMAFRFSVCGVILSEEQKASVWFTNPKENTVWLKLRIMDVDGNIMGESGIIRPGEYVKDISLTGEIFDKIPIVLKVMSYEPETYYSEGAVSLNTNIKPLS